MIRINCLLRKELGITSIYICSIFTTEQEAILPKKKKK